MRHFCYILFVALAVFGSACKRAPKSSFDMQKSLASLGVSVRKITLNPSMLTPFLDSRNSEEAALKKFLGCVNEVNIFSLPNKQVLDELALRVQSADYEQKMDLQQQLYRMWVYVLPADGKRATSLVLLLQESEDVLYGVEMSGHIEEYTLTNLSRISPAFFDSYIRRFNVKF